MEESSDSEEVETSPTVDAVDAENVPFDTAERQLKALLDGSDLPDSAPRSVIGEVIADTYELLKELGAGGMGEVFLAQHQRTGGQVALKLIKSTRLDDESFVKRFELEARHTAALNHPNIVRVFDYGHDDDLAYLAMEYVPGDPLDVLIRKEDGLSLETAVRLTEQVLLALEAAHDEGLIHRDIKPPNILVSGYGTDQFVKVLDFGIARALEGETANTQGAIGSPNSMAPEQFEGGDVSPATDLYALGCTVHAMVSGSPPFSGPYWKLATLHCVEPAPRLQGVPEAFADWVLQLLEKSPEDRPGSARAALESLRAIDLAAPVEDEPPPTTDRGETVPPAGERANREQSTPSVVERPGAALVDYGEDELRGRLAPASRGRWVLGAGLVASVAFGVAFVATSDRQPEKPAPQPLQTAGAAAKEEPTTPTERPLTMRGVDRLTNFSLELAPDGERLLFLFDNVLEVVDVDGDSVTPIPLPEGEFWNASWHPDGERLSINGVLGPKAPPCAYTLTTSGELEELLCDTKFAALSPDSSQLAYIAKRGIVIGDTNGADARLVDEDSPVSRFRWLSDGNAVLYAAKGRDEKYEIRAASRERTETLLEGLNVNVGVNVVEFGTLRDRGLLWREGDELWRGRVDVNLEVVDRERIATAKQFQHARMSSDAAGSKLLYCRATMQADIRLAALDGLELGDVRTVSPSSFPERPITWSVDGSQLYFVSRRSKKLTIYAFDPAEQKVAPVVESDGGIGSVNATQGGVIFVEWLDGEATLNTVKDGERRSVGASVKGADLRCSAEPEPRCLVHQVSDVKHTFRFVDLDSGELLEPKLELPISKDSAPDFRQWDWAPDEQLLVFAQSGGTTVEIFSTTSWERIRELEAQTSQYLHFIRWSADRSGVFISTGGPPFGVYHLGRDDSWTTLVDGVNFISRPTPSPDGKHLAWSETPYKCVPWIMELSGGKTDD